MLNYGNIFDNEGISYTTFRALVTQLLLEGKTTGPDHSEAMLHYTKMNNQRMNRVEKTTSLSDEILETVAKIKVKYHFLVISEGWCGDAAQIVPVIDKIVSSAPNKFDLKLVLRDKNLPLIDAHLTNGGRAIPVLLILDENKNLVLPKWGPRPAVLQALLADWKRETEDMGLIAERLHGWYAKDKTQATQAELVAVLRKLK
ncbi:thioredoxin family protein [Pedobacter polaris]|uniref:Thioredoxin family protein n=1 Tax=Pedobacter polaris TaxID=2571273 RepID=A0A4U1CT49_9SPHI|nr:thioredoxin family protein [Pedobacter polaris]TKC12337.1 thioredoxin family protein [Pedobacter polaris]